MPKPKSKPGAAAFAAAAVAAKESATLAPVRRGEITHLQLRLDYEDAERFRAAARRRRLSLQAALVEATNLLLAEWGEPPVSDPGTSRK